MGKRKHHDELQIDQSLTYQKREWIFERVGWTVMALVVAAGLAGVFGRGPVSKTRASDPFESLALEYDRFLRYSDPTKLQVTLAPMSTADETIRIWLAQEYLDSVEVLCIRPEPLRQELARDGQVFVFGVTEPRGPLRVTFHVKPDHVGSLAGQIRVGAYEPVSFEQFVYP
jgi:hypothetical protein